MKLCYLMPLCLAVLDACHGVSLSEFYSFGEGVGDRRVPNQDEGATEEIKFRHPFVFYGETYFSYFINVNGIISFLTEIPYFFNTQFPLDYPVIAPFYSDIDTSGSGNIWYRETSDPTTIQKAILDLSSNFERASGFRPSSISIITYESVGAYQARSDRVNTFQIVLITDSVESFVLFHYADGGLQWLQGDGKTSGLPDALGQAGFVAMDGRLFTLRGSGTDQVRNLDRWSNVDRPGVWMFRVGQVDSGKNIQPPSIGAAVDAQLNSHTDGSESSCAYGGAICHSSGRCVDYDEGFCCQCNEQTFGNGINCIKRDSPIRVTGKVSGNINGVDIIDGDLHSYVLATEGRTYTAVSRIPKDVGYDLQSLTGIGEGIAWLFATPKEGVPNGFTLTGGIFNRSVEINFPQSGHKVEIQQTFEGLDVFNNVAVTTTVIGSVPTISIGSELEVDAFKEEITRVENGKMRSRSNRSFRLKGQTLETPYSMETFIDFDECDKAPRDSNIDTLRFKVAENIFIRFDEAESIVRFSFSAKIGTLEEVDPCIRGRKECGAHSQCIVDGDNYRCVCEQGFDYYYDSSIESTLCLDMNECDLGRDLCDKDALCINNEGSYSCQCNRGFAGDGHYCRPEFTCHNAGCDHNALCEEINGQPECRCNVGYTGDGFFCSPDFGDDSCHVSRNCSPYAVCAPEGEGFACKCLEGYVGDGYRCELSPYPAPRVPPFQTGLQLPIYPETFPTLKPYDPFHESVVIGSLDDDKPFFRSPDCQISFEGIESCFCPEGYTHNLLTTLCELDDINLDIYRPNLPQPVCDNGKCVCEDGYVFNFVYKSCDPYQEAQSCNVINTCHADGQCLYYGDREEYRCACNAGYTGDGHYCYPVEVSCDQMSICHFHADCIYDDIELKSICVCKQGFYGDGLNCAQQDECNHDEDCDQNAQCSYEDHLRRYSCVCVEGFEGDGLYCSQLTEPEEETSCHLLNCDLNADCLRDIDGEFRCQCHSGFEGDGYFCQKMEIACNILNNCDSTAECLYDEVSQGFKCRCREGYSGDGSYCQAAQTCLVDPNICDPRATCERSPIEEFSAACVCRSGYTGDGLNCERTPDHEKNILLMNQGLSVLRMPINQEFSNGFPIIVDPYMTAVGADIDCLNGRYYWTDVGSRSIRSSKYDGTEKMPLISGRIGSPEDVAVDWVSKIVYWTDSLNDLIAVSDIEGQIVRTVIKEELVNPRGITVHPGLGLLFWSDWNRENPKIEVSGMDGSDRKLLVSGSEIRLPNSLVVDYETTSLCWADAGTHKIECIGVDGFGRRVVIENILYPFGLTLHKRNFFYTDWNDTSIHEVEKYSGTEVAKRLPPLGGSGKLYGIVAVPDSCPPVSNVCQIGNGGCQDTHLCLPNGRGGRLCGCSDESQNTLEQCTDYQY